MATTTTLPAAASTAVPTGTNSGGAANTVLAAYATVDLTANVTANDVYNLFKLPKGALVVGGSINADDIDSNATETLQASLGIQDNGVDGADLTYFIPASLLNGDALSETDLNNFRPITKHVGKQFRAVTTVALKFPAVAATFAAGSVKVVVLYTTPGTATS